MFYLLLFGIGIPVFALVFSLCVVFLGIFWDRFRTSGPGGFKVLYGKMLIIAAIFLVLSVMGVGGILGLAIMGSSYKAVFGASWVEALVIGILGGSAGWIMLILAFAALAEMGFRVM